MQRALAVLVAVLLIAGAVVLRGRMDAGSSGGDDAGAVTGTLVCATELGPVCDQVKAANPGLTVRTEEAGTTFATLTAPDFNREATGRAIDTWLVPQPWPAMVDEQRQAASLGPVLDEPSGVLARSPLVLATWQDRADALTSTCPSGSVDWACLGNAAGSSWKDLGGRETWGVLKLSHPEADRSVTGLDVVAQGTAEQLGRGDYARNDLQDPAYQAWLAQLEGAVDPPRAGTALGNMLTQGPAAFDAVGALEAEAGPAVAASRRDPKPILLYPSPVITADVVAVPVRGSGAGGRVKQLLESGAGAEALAAHGWRVAGQAPIDGVGREPLPDGNGLPRAGVLLALREVWSEVTG